MELRPLPSNSSENQACNRRIIDAYAEESTFRQIPTIESVGDSITFIDGTTSSWNKDYRCLRKAFLIFIISFELNWIQQAAGIVHQFFHLYPTFVGWLYLATKMKRLMFSFLELIGQHPCDDNRKGYAEDCSTMSDKDQTQPDYDFKSVLSDDTLHKRRNLKTNEMRLIERIRSTLTKSEPNELENELDTDDNTDSRRIVRDTSPTSSSNKNNIDSTTRSKSGINISKRKNSNVPTNTHLISQFDESRDDIADSSWGHFVDCPSEDYSDEIQIQMEDISRIRQVFSEDYGHFVDIQEE